MLGAQSINYKRNFGANNPCITYNYVCSIAGTCTRNFETIVIQYDRGRREEGLVMAIKTRQPLILINTSIYNKLFCQVIDDKPQIIRKDLRPGSARYVCEHDLRIIGI